MYPRLLRALQSVGAVLSLAGALSAESLRFDAASEWQTWPLPLGIVALDAAGVIRPVEIRKNPDPVRDAAAFGGGIHAAGSNSLVAARAIDGDRQTGWSPNLADDLDDWWIEIDLGRAVAARRVMLTFLATAPPCALFDVLLSTGEPAIDVVGNPIEGSLVYRVQERFKENQRPQQVAGRGFDHLAVETSAPIEFVSVLVEGEVVEATAEPTEGGLAIALATPVKSRQLVELRFAGTVFVDATRFDAFIGQGQVRQRVEAGDASSAVASSTNAVRLPVGARLLANVSMGPLWLTPNGDGVNDALQVEFDLVNMLAARSVGLRIFDLAGPAGVGAGRGGPGRRSGLGLGRSGALGCAGGTGVVHRRIAR